VYNEDDFQAAEFTLVNKQTRKESTAIMQSVYQFEKWTLKSKQ